MLKGEADTVVGLIEENLSSIDFKNESCEERWKQQVYSNETAQC